MSHIEQQVDRLRESLAGRYTIRRHLGSGGMADVFLAHDERHDRQVAIKVLQPTISGSLGTERFLREIRVAAKLNHPNIVTLLDSGSSTAGPYYVMPYVDGETLRNRLDRERQLPYDEAVRLAQQIASAIDYAHRLGVLHRDIKPENVLIGDGHAFVTDFGIARAIHVAGDATSGTTVGTVLGTPVYMSPEQASGETKLDPRSDLYSLACVVFEMLAGRPPFVGPTRESVLTQHRVSAPPKLTDLRTSVPVRAASAINRALTKVPADRQAGVMEFARELDSASFAAVTAEMPTPPRRMPLPPARTIRRGAGILVAAAVLTALGFAIGRRSGGLADWHYQPLTFREGRITGAAFMPDGQSVVYSSAWNGEPEQLFFTRTDFSESRPLGLQNARLVAVSRKGELAVLIDMKGFGTGMYGTLARMSPDGGSPRPLLEGVGAATWHPDAEELAVVRTSNGRARLEFPAGTVLYESPGWIGSPEFSPDGRWIAFVDHRIEGSTGGRIVLVDLSGEARVLLDSGDYEATSLAWRPDGREIIFSAITDEIEALHAVDLAGHVRVVTRAPVHLLICDVLSADDLLALTWRRRNVAAGLRREGDAWRETDLTWLEWTRTADISEDGRNVLLADYSSGVGGSGVGAALRRLPGGELVRLGDFEPLDLSPDGSLVLGRRGTEFVVVPTGAGQSRTLASPAAGASEFLSCWMPDSRHVLIGFRENGVWHTYLQGLDSDERRQVGADGWRSVGPPRPDGSSVLMTSPDGRIYLVPLAAGNLIPLELHPEDRLVQWHDNATLCVAGPGIPCSIDLLDVRTGVRRAWRRIEQDEGSGIGERMAVHITPDGNTATIDRREIHTALVRMRSGPPGRARR